MKLTLKIWRQHNASTDGAFKTYEMDHVSPDMSFLEMLDVLNESLIKKGEDPVHFDHDCREGICGMCSLYINGRPHGPLQTTTCQLHMRSFSDGQTITIEPWRANAFPVVKDLVVDRSAFDRIQRAGGYVSVNTGGVQDANSILIPKKVADEAMDAATCIGCGACVAACKNASAMLLSVQKFHNMPCYHRDILSAKSVLNAWWRRWMLKVLVHVRTPVPVRPSVQRELRSPILRE